MAVVDAIDKYVGTYLDCTSIFEPSFVSIVGSTFR